jgi:hypothetical protein
MFQIILKYSNIFHSKALENTYTEIWIFENKNKPSGNPDSDILFKGTFFKEAIFKRVGGGGIHRRSEVIIKDGKKFMIKKSKLGSRGRFLKTTLSGN